MNTKTQQIPVTIELEKYLIIKEQEKLIPENEVIIANQKKEIDDLNSKIEKLRRRSINLQKINENLQETKLFAETFNTIAEAYNLRRNYFGKSHFILSFEQFFYGILNGRPENLKRILEQSSKVSTYHKNGDEARATFWYRDYIWDAELRHLTQKIKKLESSRCLRCKIFKNK